MLPPMGPTETVLTIVLAVSMSSSINSARLRRLSGVVDFKIYQFPQFLIIVVASMGILQSAVPRLAPLGPALTLVAKMALLLWLPNITNFLLRLGKSRVDRIPWIIRHYPLAALSLSLIGFIIISMSSRPQQSVEYYTGGPFLFVYGSFLLSLMMWIAWRRVTGEGPLIHDRVLIIMMAFISISSLAISAQLFLRDPGTAWIHGRPLVAIVALELLMMQFVVSRIVDRWMGLEFKAKRSAEGQVASLRKDYRRMAYNDLLTGLPNSNAMSLELQKRTEIAEEFCLVFLSIDGFVDMQFNTGLDHGADVLKATGRRLKEALGLNSQVYRIDGNSFATVHSKTGNRRMVEIWASSLLGVFDEDLVLEDGSRQNVSLSLGAACYPIDATDINGLRERAMISLQSAEKKGKSKAFFHPLMEESSRRNYRIFQALREAVESKDFQIHYQPIFDDQGRIIQAEALVRSSHPELRDLSPDYWIPVAEKTGLVEDISRMVWSRAMAAAKILELRGFQIAVAVNLSPRAIEQETFRRFIYESLDNPLVQAGKIHVEITETAIIEGRDAVRLFLVRLREAGIKVSLDDFGTGYATLTYLTDLPVDVVKIDRSFITNIAEAVEDQVICRSIVQLADGLGKGTVAEGVESRMAYTILKDMGCQSFQGWHFGRPMALEDFLLLKTNALPQQKR